MSGLIAGSIAPDFEKFLKMELGNTYSHTVWGLLWFNLPLGVLLCFLYHTIVREPFINHLPRLFRVRLIRFRNINWNYYFRNYYLVVAFSVLIGATSHLTWDSFTHEGGKGVRLVPFLSETILIGYSRIALYKLLDHLSSVSGLLLIFYVLLKLPVTHIENKQPGNIWVYWVIVLITSLLVIVLKILFDSRLMLYWELLVSSISALLIGLVFSSLIVKLKYKV